MRAIDNLPHTLYRFWDAEGRLLYVGIALDFLNRWRKHRKTKWWPQVARIEVRTYPNRPLVEAAERAAIKLEKPLHNKVHNKENLALQEGLEEARRAASRGMSRWEAYSFRLFLAPWSDIRPTARIIRMAEVIFMCWATTLMAWLIGVVVTVDHGSSAGFLAGGLVYTLTSSLMIGLVADALGVEIWPRGALRRWVRLVAWRSLLRLRYGGRAAQMEQMLIEARTSE